MGDISTPVCARMIREELIRVEFVSAGSHACLPVDVLGLVVIRGS